jgi:hypothetical protein
MLVTIGAVPLLIISLGAGSNVTARACHVPAFMASPPFRTAGQVDAHRVRSNVPWSLGGKLLPVFLNAGRVDAHLSDRMVLLGYVPPCPSPDITAGDFPSLEGICFVHHASKFIRGSS